MDEPTKTGKKTVERNPDGTIKSGALNPNGRPKGSFSLKTLIVKKLEEQPDLREKIIADLFEKEQALIFQMIDGRPLQKNELGGMDGEPLGVVILPPKDVSSLEATA